MKFREATIPGLYIIDIEPHVDERGFFARAFCAEEFSSIGLPRPNVQMSVSRNYRQRTLRGLHFQKAPHEEDKLIRVNRGAIFDVAVDIREGSPSFGEWFGLELDAQSQRALFIPKGFAHGFLTLSDDTDVLYQMSVPFVAGFGGGIRWDDPSIGIKWPFPPAVINERDSGHPSLKEVFRH